MAFLSTKNVGLTGISACVPTEIEENRSLTLFQNDEAEKFISSTGVVRRHIADEKITTSDLCYHAAEKIINDMGLEREDIGCLVFVSQTPDYILPATSCILQERLHLNQDCYAIDISLGCSGWIYGVSVITSLMQTGAFKIGLLLVGDTVLKYCSKNDRSTWPLFGDAGTASVFQYEEGKHEMKFHFGTDGSGYKAIIVPEGGFRTPFNSRSLKEDLCSEERISRNKVQMTLNGMDVFTFGISRAPETINKLCEKFNIDRDTVDAYFFHQANLFMNEKICKKLKLPANKVPYSLTNFGNTSVSTIPLTMVTEWREKMINERQKIIACAFGVGLSWGSLYFESNKIFCSELIFL
jgi:3-oxoacyl-[acyl-carrier-protein] synthase III